MMMSSASHIQCYLYQLFKMKIEFFLFNNQLIIPKVFACLMWIELMENKKLGGGGGGEGGEEGGVINY